MIQNSKSKISKLCIITLMLVGILWVVFIHTDVIAWYSAKYTDSAHGSISYGVNRSGTGYNVGDCANCHDPNDPDACVNELMLFAPMNQDSQTDNFCFQCHKGTGSVQVGGVTNYTYSKNFGGGTATFTNIYDTFNTTTGSSHNLKDIQDYVTGKVGFTSDTNPCVVCHNPHTAQRNYPVESSGRGGVNTATRRVRDYQDRNTNLWGDEDYTTSGYFERMRDATLYYQAPLRADSGYEPKGGTTSEDKNGSYLPNFGTFCYDCHYYGNVASTEHGILDRINWGTDYVAEAPPNRHGTYHSDETGMGYTIAPYTGGETKKYILSCTDCHEPHGSPNEWLLRTSVNGKDNISVPEPGEWWEFCTACHVLTNGTDMYHKPPPRAAPICPTCHGHSTIFF